MAAIMDYDKIGGVLEKKGGEPTFQSFCFVI